MAEPSSDREEEVLNSIVLAFENWQQVGQVIVSAKDEGDAVRAISELLGVSAISAGAILDQQWRSMLPEWRERLARMLADVRTRDR